MAENVDRTIDLPLDVQWKILYLLPLIEAARLSLLSKHWRTAWLSIPILDLDLTVVSKRNLLGPSYKTWQSWPAFADLVLPQFHCTTIRRLSLSPPGYFSCLAELHRWPPILATRGVAELYLSHCVVVSASLLSVLGQTLTVLSLSHCRIYCAENGCRRTCGRGRGTAALGHAAPKLKRLEIQNGFVCGNALQSMLLGCPALESLVVNVEGVELVELDVSCSKNLRCLDYYGYLLDFKLSPETRLEKANVRARDPYLIDVEDERAVRTTAFMMQFLHAHTISLHDKNFMKGHRSRNMIGMGRKNVLYILEDGHGSNKDERVGLVNQYFAMDFARERWDRSIQFTKLSKLFISVALSEKDQVAAIVYLLTSAHYLQDLVVVDREEKRNEDNPWRSQEGHFPYLRRVKIYCVSGGLLLVWFVILLAKNAPLLETLTIGFRSQALPEEVEEMKQQMVGIKMASKVANIVIKKFEVGERGAQELTEL